MARLLRHAAVPCAAQPAAPGTTTILVLETSASMSQPDASGQTSKIDAAKRSAESVTPLIQLESAGGGGSEGLITFSDQISTPMTLGQSVQQIQDAAGALQADGNTDIYGALQKALDELAAQGNGADQSVILITDGMQTSPDRPESDFLDDPAGSVQRAQAAHIDICTIGFGQPTNIDQSLLNAIGSQTGCKSYAAGQERDLLQSLIKAQVSSSGGDLLSDLSGAVSQGQTVTAGNFAVSPGVGRLEVTLAWPGSTLDLHLKDPASAVVDTSYPGASVGTTATTANVTVNNPKQGQWSTEVVGRQVSQPNEPFDAIVSTHPLAPASATPTLPLTSPTPPPSSSPSPALPTAIALAVAALAIGGVVFAMRLRRGEARPALGGGFVLVASGGVRVPLRAGPQVLGRDPSCEIRLSDDDVSRRHARITVGSGGAFLEDLGSANGTFVNGRPVSRALLQPGDVLRLGRTELQLHAAAPAAARAR